MSRQFDKTTSSSPPAVLVSPDFIPPLRTMSVNEVKLKRATTPLVVKGTPTASTFCIGDEDHTMGNSLRHILMHNKVVSFAGYSVPHPSEPVVQIRVQTKDNEPAADVLKEACQTLADQCDIILDKLETLLPDVKADRQAIEEQFMGDEEEEEEEEEEEGRREMVL